MKYNSISCLNSNMALCAYIVFALYNALKYFENE